LFFKRLNVPRDGPKNFKRFLGRFTASEAGYALELRHRILIEVGEVG